MTISTNNQINSIAPQTAERPNSLPKGKVFEQFFTSALDLVNETNRYQINAESLQRDFATGRTDNILAVTMAQEQAATSLNFTVQVTNRLIEAYREIIRIQL